MKRMHINIGVENLDQSIAFYSALFNAPPAKTEHDYAKWMLEDPGLNFAISTRAKKIGINHLGLQVDTEEELEQLRENIKTAERPLFDEGEAMCCYARSEKSWVQDPTGIAWEAFRTLEDVPLFSGFDANDDASAQKKESNGHAGQTVEAQASGCCG